jgi:DNA-binding response OmpR family regulator
MLGGDDSNLVVHTALECAGFECTRFADVLMLLRGVKRDDVSLVLIDADVADADWQAVLKWRSNWLNPSVITLVIGADDPIMAACALDAGADDYVAKPIRGVELVARVAAAKRRRGEADAPQHLQLGGCTLDALAGTLRSARATVSLTAREVALAQVLFRNSGKIMPRQRIASEVWGLSEELSSRTIEQHVYQIRRKLARCVGEAVELRSVYGRGYVLNVVDTDLAPATPASPHEEALQARHMGPRLVSVTK